jgi:hypothetical protein
VFDFAVECDRLGVTEYWIGEHATMSWESITNPELNVAAFARETNNIKLCPEAGHTVDRETSALCATSSSLTPTLKPASSPSKAASRRCGRSTFSPSTVRSDFSRRCCPGMDVADVDLDTLVEKVWIVGSPDTVAEKLAESCEKNGGWMFH